MLWLLAPMILDGVTLSRDAPGWWKSIYLSLRFHAEAWYMLPLSLLFLVFTMFLLLGVKGDQDVKFREDRLEEYKRFLPDGAAHNELRVLTRFLCGEDLDVEAQLVLDREETPRFGLDADTEPPRLGWISWMFSRPLDRDPDETILRFY